MAFGLDSTGFTKKKLSDIKLSLEDALTAVFGVIDTSPESVFGQLVGVISEASSKVWDMAEAVYLSQYPASAEGVQLDYAVGLTGITRLDATPSVVVAAVEGDEGTVVTAGTQFKQVNTNNIFAADDDVTITRLSALKAVISIFSTGASNEYTVQLDGNTSTINTASTDVNTILALLKIEIENNQPIHTVVHDTSEETLTIYVDDEETAFIFHAGTNITIEERWTPVPVSAAVAGSTAIPANSITSIETPIAGMNSVDNYLAGTAGRDTETDDELRLRRRRSLKVVGAASVPAIEARISQEVDGVLSVRVIENPSDDTDSDGRPPHSFEAIVAGGDEQEIAEKIWEVKAAGINTFSANSPLIEKQVLDSEGTIQIIRFSRPITKYVHMNIEISLYDEETFPDGGAESIKAALVAFGQGLQAGDNIIRQRFYSAIFSVAGVEEISLFELAITEVDEAQSTKETGSVSIVTANKLVDSGATFITNGVVEGMIVRNNSVYPTPYAVVLDVESETSLLLSDNIFTVLGQGYAAGVFGNVNVPMAENQVGDYDDSRISITII